MIILFQQKECLDYGIMRKINDDIDYIVYIGENELRLHISFI